MSGLPVLLRWLTGRHFARHRVRSALALLSVAVGVATFVAMLALNRSMLESFDHTARQRAGGADWVVTASGGVPEELVSLCRGAPGVRAAVPLLWRFHFARRAEGDPESTVLLLGVDPAAGGPSGEDFTSELIEVAPAAELLRMARPVFVGEEFAREAGIEVGSAIEVSAPRGYEALRVAGILRSRPERTALSRHWLVTTLSVAGELVGMAGRVDRVLLYCDDPAAARQFVEAALPAGARLQDPARDARDYDAVLGSVRVAGSLLSLLSLAMAAFLVHSTLSMALTERRRELAILRCVGLSAASMRRLLLLEALVLGLLGTLPGLALGAVLARGLGHLYFSTVGSTFDRVARVGVQVETRESLVGALAGLLTALVSVWLPARAVSRQAPLRGLRDPDAPSSKPDTLSAWLAALLVVGAALLVLGRGFGIPRAGYGGVVALMLALMLGAYPLLCFFTRRLRRWSLRAGPALRLAQDHFERSRAATRVTLVAISLGFGMVTATHGIVQSFEDMLETWFQQTVREELFVFGRDLLASGLDGASFDRDLAAEVRRLPGVLHVQPMRFVRIDFRGQRVLLMSLDGAAPEVSGTFLYEQGSPRDRAALARGEGVFASAGLAYREGLRRGDRVALPAPGGDVVLPVLAVVVDYTWPLGSFLMDDDAYARLYGDPLVHELAITGDGSVPRAEVQRRLVAMFEGRFPVLVRTREEVIGTVFQTFREYWSLFLAQESLAVMVAFLGTLHTLLISVWLRRREIGLLRAVGAPRAMVQRMILLEGTVLGLAGGVFGLLFGGGVATITLQLLSLEEQGYRPPLSMSPLVLVGLVAFAAGTGCVAGWFPAREAARVPLLEALRED